MVEVSREGKRTYLRQASAIAVCVDDRNGFKLARIRCDHASGARVGLLGIVRRSGGVTPLESFEEDYCERDAETIQNMLKSFCTSMTGEFDEGLFDHISARVRIYVSDGAASALKTGRILKDNFSKTSHSLHATLHMPCALPAETLCMRIASSASSGGQFSIANMH
jgi:hypothetical protein